MKNRMVVIYDGIHNSVFQGQVVQPLIKQLNAHPDEHGIIISFERNSLSNKQIKLLIPDPRITVIILYKLPFLGSLSLRYAVYQLKKILNRYWPPHTITARGPLAGWIVGNVDVNVHVPRITIQARGLAAQEYRYTHANSSYLTQWYRSIRAHQYERIEQWVYGVYSYNKNVLVRAISYDLKQYLVDTFTAPSSKIKIEHVDIPSSITTKQKYEWRKRIRKQIGIPSDAYVYVYNGSAKPWQCPQETVQFFAKKYSKNTHCFLLVLTQDVSTFTTLFSRYNLPSHAFYVTHVAHNQMYQYLAAANAGILLRKAHVVNWVSRPTKALEYQAVGLKIIHNNTVGMLSNAASSR